jgi:hypothetical protein
MHEQDQQPHFARQRNDARDTTELRVEARKSTVSIIDATWMAIGGKESRNSIVNKILDEWAERKWHEASVLLKVVPSNPVAPDSEGAQHG